jgi:hypothetical protein
MKKLPFIIPPYFNADDYLDNGRTAVLPQFTIPYGILSCTLKRLRSCHFPNRLTHL